MKSEQALVFHIQHYSLHDGPGIRTIVFFKGCPLRCRWCCNPESQRSCPEVSCVADRCIRKEACGFCAQVCPAGAVTFEAGGGSARIDRGKCTDCLACAGACPSRAIRVQGEVYSVQKLADIVERDAAFFTHGDGGLTVSGGEPLSQGRALIALLQEAKQRRLHTAIETCGYGAYEVLREAARDLDMIHFDLKTLDADRHQAWTGKRNDIILDNLRRLCEEFPDKPKKVRTPVVPGLNDDAAQLSAISDFVKGLPGTEHELLAYHSFGKGKYRALGRTYPMGDEKLDERHFAALRKQIGC